MTITTTIVGVNTRGDDADIKVRTEGAPDVIHVEMPREAAMNEPQPAGTFYTCQHCGQGLDGDEPNDGKWCANDDERCPSPNATDEMHEPVPVPLSWLNSARILFDADNDQVLLSVSTADPRGGFAMIMRRERYTDLDGKPVDELRLSVPHESDGQLHDKLTLLNGRGYFKVG